MPPAPTGEQTRRPLRLWPGLALALIVFLGCFVAPRVLPDAALGGLIAGMLGALAILVWWLFFSRAPNAERWIALALSIAALFAVKPFLHFSVAGAGMGMMYWICAIPTVAIALVLWAAFSRRLTPGLRFATLAAALLAGAGLWTLLRTDGILGAKSQFAWRWSKTAEEKLLASAPADPVPPPTPPPVEPVKEPTRTVAETKGSIPAPKPTPPDWPGFRGPHRDDRITGVTIKTDWSASPPRELWRRPIGPGWSSFAVGGGLIYTQEQRGDSEVVTCYNASTGKPVWTHRDAARFYESNGGPGPRGTPTLDNGHIYTLGATGILNALDAATGKVIWTRNAAADTGAKTPGWGFSGSPLIVDDLVIVATAGRLAAYEIAAGAPRWHGLIGGGYSSPHLLSLDGVPQVVLLNDKGATGVSPADGKVLWTHAWEGAAILQPAITPDGALLIATSDMSGGTGTRRLAVSHKPSGWAAEEVWTSKGLKPYFSDFVVHNGHAYGFDGSILSCIDLKDGSRKWKGGRYGQGQLLLLADQDLLLVISEEGELALVSATPDQFTEIAKAPAIEGKTWNHPVLIGHTLLVRNGQEMAAFRL